MAKDRSTFSEHWYRVAELRPSLMPAAAVRKQHFRGRDWMVIQSPLNSEYFRLHAAAYGFIALLDGRRTVSEAWELVNRRFGDAAPTQGEAIQLMGRLYQSNLLRAELPPDSAELFKRFKERRSREFRHAASSVLFPKFPLFDPNITLGQWLPLFSWLFGPMGLAVFLAATVAGVWSVLGKYDELYNSSAGILSVDNLLWLYLAFVFSKTVHELASAIASKRYGRMEGDAGQVREAGIMLLMLAPAPYIDTSGAWGLRNKLHRVIASAAGILGEFTVAAVAAVVWAQSAPGSVTHAVSYNLMFVASVSTFLFNGNPLLRYDAYYILCDLLETPNLAGRSQQYLYYLVKHYVWRVESATSPAHTRFERVFFFCYGIAAGLYRVFLLGGILLTVAELAFFLGVALAIAFGVMWVVVPVGKFVRYLLTNGELARVRTRAIATTSIFFLLAAGVFFLIPFPDRFRLEGMAEAPRALKVFAQTDGKLDFILPNTSLVGEEGTAVIRLDNPWLAAELDSVKARERELEARFRDAERKEPAEAQSWRERLAALRTERRRVESKIAALTVSAPIAGTWFSPQLTHDRGRFVRQGDLLGEIIPGDTMIIRAMIGQDGAASLLANANRRVEIRVKGRPDLDMSGDIAAVHPAGKKDLPTPAMGIPAGGGMQVDASDTQGTTSQEHFFEIEVRPHGADGWTMRQGQMFVLRFSTRAKPLWAQCYRSLLQMFQKRFQV